MEKEKITKEEEYDVLKSAYPFELVFGEDRKMVISLLKSIGNGDWIESGGYLIRRDDTDSEHPIIDVFKLKYTIKLDKIPKKIRDKLGIKLEVEDKGD